MRRASLKAQALAWLAQREHSVAELKRKLRRKAEAEAAHAASSADGGEALPQDAPARAARIDELIDELVAAGHLSDERFAQSRVRVRAGRYGNVRIRRELALHGVEIAPDAARELAATERQRALAVWQRRYGAAPADAKERARQARFLASRGFSADVVRDVLRLAHSDGDIA